MNVADYIIRYLENKGVNTIFQVPGGGAMFLNDSVAKSKKIKPVFCHHEQSCAMAAVGYSKTINKPGVIIVTSGCGSTNTITGVLDAYQDSNPMFIISGQANIKDTTYMSRIPLRKLGVQEVNILEIVKPITKYSAMLTEYRSIDILLDKMWYECINGRPGPVWLDIPLDIQSIQIDESQIIKSTLVLEEPPLPFDKELLNSYLQNSKRPIIVAGNGIHLANARWEFMEFIEKYQIPYVCTFLGTDLLPEDHPLYIGRMGIKGTRAGNFALANADLIISLGSSLSIPAIGFQYHLFGREAKKLVVDIDEFEHHKETIKIDDLIQTDVKYFMEQSMDLDYETDREWSYKCLEWKNKWSPFDRKDIDELNMYSFSQVLSRTLKGKGAKVVTDAGSAYYVLAQSMRNARLILPSAQGEMGFMIPASIGAWYSDPGKVVGVTGEGSFQFNIQELQTIVHNNMDIHLFVLNNGGYLSIKNTQNKFFEGRLSGTDETSGISFPDLEKISKAYGIKFDRINNKNILELKLGSILDHKGPTITEIMCPHDEAIYPTSATQQMEDGSLKSQPLENMFPFLAKEEFENEMIVSILR